MRSILAALGLLAALATPAAAGPYCYGELSAGGNFGSNKLADASTGASITIASEGYTGGLGAGCDVQIDRFVLGAFGRYELTHITGQIDTTKFTTDGVWTIAARGGVMINPSTLVYGLLGISGQTIDIKDIQKIDGKGLVYGAGLETDLAYGWRIGAEITRTDLGAFAAADGSGSSIHPTSTAARVTFKRLFHFGE